MIVLPDDPAHENATEQTPLKSSAGPSEPSHPTQSPPPYTFTPAPPGPPSHGTHSYRTGLPPPPPPAPAQKRDRTNSPKYRDASPQRFVIPLPTLRYKHVRSPRSLPPPPHICPFVASEGNQSPLPLTILAFLSTIVPTSNCLQTAVKLQGRGRHAANPADTISSNFDLERDTTSKAEMRGGRPLDAPKVHKN
ncbi:hypothetical protein DFP72DRAFT_1062082 [Ephemerocybe angulata]|uniref:Uncharacterized protein n=1 Tax=Ephemerocybe angulata TaxID=980116 RepID=A0A8H6IBB9_9AGAR|nr:hypothetical protein DFP72DRAFT_1062082 [Tulosesus angulatus]